MEPLPEPKEHIALDAMKSALLLLQNEQEDDANQRRAIAIINLETAILWQKHSMGLID